MHYQPHPAAELFPMLSDAELDELAADIKINGQHEPIEILDMLVLDGRNRQEACRRAGVPVKWCLWESNGRDPVAWVLSKNLLRRHLNESQRALIAAAALPLLEVEARKRMESGVAPRGARVGKASEVAASAVGASARSVERAKALVARAPAAEIEKIRSGEKTLKQVERETKRLEQVAQVRAYVPPVGEYPVITIDPPWAYDDTLDGSDAVRGGCPYPSMPIVEIAGLKIPVAVDCAVFLWVTNSHLVDPDAYAVVVRAWRDRYGLVPKQIRTWRKTQMGLGRVWRNITEHLVLLVRGSPVFAPVTQTTDFEAPAGEHSEKPQRAYTDIEALCPSTSRLEMFARAPRTGWITHGAELPAAKKTRRLQLVDETEAA